MSLPGGFRQHLYFPIAVFRMNLRFLRVLLKQLALLGPRFATPPSLLTVAEVLKLVLSLLTMVHGLQARATYRGMGLQPIKPWMAEKAHSTLATVRIYANVNKRASDDQLRLPIRFRWQFVTVDLTWHHRDRSHLH
jgi:hypothetical protein